MWATFVIFFLLCLLIAFSLRLCWRLEIGANLSVAFDFRQSRADSVNNIPSRRQHPKKGCGPSVNYCIAIHRHLEFTIAPVSHFDFNVQLTSKLRRHTDGV